LKLVQDSPELKEKVCVHSSIIKAQVAYARVCEMAEKPEDIIYRRLSVGYNACFMKQCHEDLKNAIAKEF